MATGDWGPQLRPVDAPDCPKYLYVKNSWPLDVVTVGLSTSTHGFRFFFVFGGPVSQCTMYWRVLYTLVSTSNCEKTMPCARTGCDSTGGGWVLIFFKQYDTHQNNVNVYRS